MSLLFARKTAAFGSNRFSGGEMRAGVQPSGQNRASGKERCFAGKIGEDSLCNILRPMCVAINLSQRGRINEIKMTPHEFREGIFGPGFGIVP
jgi:hypothetical protein